MSASFIIKSIRGKSEMKAPRKLCKNCFSTLNVRDKECSVCGYSGGSGEASVLPRGTVLANRYIIGGSIGNGGFGITYLAYDTRGGEKVAVKEYFPSMFVRREKNNHVIPCGEKNAARFNIGAEKFFEEAELVRQFNGNPNIVSIYECFYENNTAYYVMEYLDGITLENYVVKYGALNSAQTLYIADKLSMALVIMHSGRVIHRDISPDNVMLCRDGKVKLIDFGAAREILSESSSGYTVIMKTGFSPIEQYTQNAEADERGDIYSLGMLLYYALTGKVPETPYERIEDDSAFAENTVNADSGLWSVIGKAADVSPSKRYRNAEELRSALAELDINETAIAAPSDYNFLKTEDFTSQNIMSKRFRTLPAVIIASVCAAVILIVFCAGKLNKPNQIEVALDSEYNGDFMVGKYIPASQLKAFDSDVEVTVMAETWEDMFENDIRGFTPVDSDLHAVMDLTAEDLWQDSNGWIFMENDSDSLSFVISRECIESLGDGGLGFEAYNLIVTSAVLKPSEKKNPLKIYDFHKDRTAPYSVSDDENGKSVTLELNEYEVTEWADFESQGIPKSAFYLFDGDVKVTLMLDSLDNGSKRQREIYIRNCGYNFGGVKARVPITPGMDAESPPISRTDPYGVHIDEKRQSFIFIIPQSMKERMSSGIFFQCMNVRTTTAILEPYNGEYDVFI